ncbi:MAG: GDSL-type esterase/lipase family protein [Syntrophales bacterium]|nr:GDSL-type esterase/lipase family protein [Syntrophales bacterium]
MTAVLVILGLGSALTLIPALVYFLSKGHTRLRQAALGLCLSGATLTLLLTGLEAFWQLAGRHLPPSLAAKIPEDLQRRNIPGSRDYYWHGHLYRVTPEGFRKAEWPRKSPQVLRIIALGDSLTYGEGVAAEETYPAVLNRLLNRTYRVEVLNLGVCGHQVSDIRGVLDRHLKELNPDLVIYGMCLNDYLPSRMPQYNGEQGALPLPRGFKDYLARNTAVFAFLTNKYDALLRRWHWRRDFFDDILLSLEKDSRLKKEFVANCATMSQAVATRGKPPILALVVTQFPKDPRGRLLADKSQDLMRQAGMEVLDDQPYFRGRAEEQFSVSPWEGHPNAQCHRIFAQILYDGLIKLHGDLLSHYRCP